MAHALLSRFFSKNTIIRVVIAALSLGIGIANAASSGKSDMQRHNGPYDNTGNGSGGFVGGGDGGG